MARNYYHNEGYTRGGLDVVTGVNLFFKGLLLFPVFILALFVGITMIKHLLFNGVPLMNSPTEEQREVIRERDQGQVSVEDRNHEEVSLTPAQAPVNIVEEVEEFFPPVPVLPEPAPRVSNVISNCPVGHPMRNVIGANGLPWVCRTATPMYEIDEDYTAQ